MKRRLALFPFILLFLLTSTAQHGFAQGISDTEKAAIRSVWAELDKTVLAGDQEAMLDVFSDQVIEIFDDNTTNVGKTNMRERTASFFTNGHFSTCESEVTVVEGNGQTAIVWVENTQVFINEESGNETIYNFNWPAIMKKNSDGEWQILTYQYVPVER
jgi:uncharacterized protein (TIGR02246 family)